MDVNSLVPGMNTIRVIPTKKKKNVKKFEPYWFQI